MPHTVKLNWNANTDTVKGYNVYTGPKGAETTKLNSTLVTDTSFIDVNPKSGDNFYAVKAVADSVNGDVESLASAEVDAVLLPNAPTGLAFQII